MQLTSFVGREHELLEVDGLLDHARLVTLTGVDEPLYLQIRSDTSVVAHLIGQNERALEEARSAADEIAPSGAGGSVAQFAFAVALAGSGELAGAR